MIPESMRPAGRRRPRRAAVLAASLPLVLLASACGSDGGSGEGGLGGEMTYWSMWQEDEPQAKVLKQAVKDFEAKTGTEVEVEWQGREVTQKLAPLLRSGEVPDLVDQAVGPISATLGTTGQATDLASVYDEKIPGGRGTVGDSGVGRYQDLATVNDTTVMVPYQALAYGLWFDAATHPELTDDPPKTLGDLSAYFAQRDAEGEKPVAIDGDYGFARALWLNTVIMRHIGAENFSELVEDETGEGWNDPKVREAVEYVGGLAEKDSFLEGSFGTKWPAQQERFAKGEGDVLFMGSWFPQEVSGSAGEDFEFSGFTLPEGPAGEPPVQTDVIGFAVPEAAANVEAAEAFIAFTLQEKYQKRLADEAGVIPVRGDVDASPALTPLADALKEREPVALFDGVPSAHPTYLAEVLNPASLGLMTGKTGAEDFLKKIRAAQVEYWKKNG